MIIVIIKYLIGIPFVSFLPEVLHFIGQFKDGQVLEKTLRIGHQIDYLLNGAYIVYM